MWGISMETSHLLEIVFGVRGTQPRLNGIEHQAHEMIAQTDDSKTINNNS